MNRRSLSHQLFIWILAIAIVPLLLTVVFILNLSKQAYLEQEQYHLSELANKKVNQIENYISERLDDAQLLAKSYDANFLLEQLPSIYQKQNKQTSDYEKMVANHSLFFEYFQDRGYYDIFLISPEGEVLYSAERESDFATNIYDGPYKNSALNQVVKNAHIFLQSFSSKFEYYPPSKEAAAFIAAPVLKEGKLLGIVALQIDRLEVESVISSTSGAFSSQEVLVAAVQDKYFSYQGPLKSNPDVKVGQQLSLEQFPDLLNKATMGISRVFITKDQLNEEVIAATRYIPSLNWGMVLKENKAEVMTEYNNMVMWLVIIFFTIVAVTFTISKIVSKKISKPFVSLSNATISVANGNFDEYIQPQGFSESFELAKNFNVMTAYVKNANQVLEKRVIERTSELQLEIQLNEKKEQLLAKTNKELNTLISDMKLTQSQLVESEKLASLGAMVAGVAHEINTPVGISVTSLSVLIHHLEITKKALLDKALTQNMLSHSLEQMEASANLLESNLQRAKNLIVSFKAVSVEQTDVQKAIFDLSALVDSLLISLKPETKKYSGDIENNIPKSFEINSYPGDFYQIFTNLILNSLIHAFEGTSAGLLTITANKDQDKVYIQIKDNGVGINSKVLSKIFQPFYTSKRGKGGSGLGLSIVYNIVNQKLHGTIDVSSVEGEGTMFVIEIPHS